ncbi:MAG: indole-3-glycerol phosphate synthase TrpC [Nitrospinota bacterium]
MKKIVDAKREELSLLKGKRGVAELRSMALDKEAPLNFTEAIKRRESGGTRIIAEIKRMSPSRGIIREDFDPVSIAKIYQAGGVAAVSCLTEKNFFGGDIGYLQKIRGELTVPLLRKDFIVDEYQIVESRAFGADAFLLIAAILDRNQMKEYIAMGRELGMEPLVEVHSEEELDLITDSGALVVGINNRDLKTFKTDVAVTERLIERLGTGYISVSESGIFNRDDIERLEGCGVDAFLIGEAIMRETDMASKLSQLIGG